MPYQVTKPELQAACQHSRCAAMQATADKNAAVAQADKTSAKAALAQRLIANLAGENQRWTLGIGSFAAAEGTCTAHEWKPKSCTPF